MTTHWHFNHNKGAIACREAFPDVTLIAERNTERWIELNQDYWMALSTAPDSARRAALATLESEPGHDAGIVARRRNELRELEALEIVTPTRLFDGRLNLDFEGVRIEMQDRGPANAPNDATVWLPRERVLFAGDILVRSPLPHVGASWPVHRVRVLRDIEAVPATAIVPGHGSVLRHQAYRREVRALLDATLVRQGRSQAQVQDELNLNDIRATVPAWIGPGVSDEDWTYTSRTLAERAFVGLRGQGGQGGR